MKCLQKEESRRYATAEAVAEDLTRFLADEPILARPVSSAEKTWRWCRRKPLTAALAASLVIVFAGGLAGVLWQWHRAKAKGEESRRHVAQLNVLSGAHLLQEGDYFKSLLWFVEALRTDAGQPEREAVHRQRIASILQQCPRLVQVVSHEGQPLAGATFSPVEDRLATVGSVDRIACVWEVPSGKLLAKSQRLRAVPHSIQISPDGTRLLIVLTDGTLCLLDAATGEFVREPLPHRLDGAWRSLLLPAVDPTSQRLVTQSGTNQLQLWDVHTGQPIGGAMIHPQPIERMEFNANGTQLFSRTKGPINFAWQAQTGTPASFPIQGPDESRPFFLAPRADWALFGGRVWRLAAPPSTHELPQSGGTSPASSIEVFKPLTEPFVDDRALLWAGFSPECGRVITARQDGTAQIWDASTGKPLNHRLAHDDQVSRAVFSPDGHRALTISQDNLTRVWDADTAEPLTPPLPHAREESSAFSSSGRYLLTLHPSYVACIWDLSQEASPPAWLKPGSGRNRRRLGNGEALSGNYDSLIYVIDANGNPGAALNPTSLKTRPHQAWIDATGRYVLLEGPRSKVQVWESASGMPMTPPTPSRVALHGGDFRQVKMPTIDLPMNQLILLIEVLAGCRLDQSGGWSLLELRDLVSKWDRITREPALDSGSSFLGPGRWPLAHWHQHEARAAERACDWWAAIFHWKRLAAVQPIHPEITQRLAHDLTCATNASAPSYYLRRRMIPPRDPRADTRQIDLSSFYNAPLSDEYADANRDVGLPIGVQDFDGTSFDVRGMIVLSGGEAKLRHRQRPNRVTGIPVQQRATRLHLLHTEQFSDGVTGEEIASLLVWYVNGQSHRVPIQHGVNVASDRFFQANELTHARVAWNGTTDLANANQVSLAVYHHTWPNPHPEWEIAQVDLVSAQTRASYVLIAVTTE